MKRHCSNPLLMFEKGGPINAMLCNMCILFGSISSCLPFIYFVFFYYVVPTTSAVPTDTFPWLRHCIVVRFQRNQWNDVLQTWTLCSGGVVTPM